MKRRNLLLAALPLLSASLAACEYQFNQDGGVMHYSFSNASSQNVSMVGGSNSLIVVNGDTVRISGGNLSVNGVSYGSVSDDDRIEYRMRNGKKSVTVNGSARHPATQAG